MNHLYQYFILPIIIGLIVHGIKLLIDLYLKRFSWSKLFGYGGMPSSHAALVGSICASVYLTEGFTSIFALCLLFGTLVLKDAVGLRGFLTEHARILNKLIKDLPDQQEFKYPILEERISHNWLQIVIGLILGIILTYLFL